MPIFHFHLRSSNVLHFDDVGQECPDLEMAYLEVCCAIPSTAARLLHRAENPMEYAFEIADDDGTPLLEVPFRETLRDTRRLTKSGLQAARLRVGTDGTHNIAGSVQSHIELVREQVRTSREWVEQARTRAERLWIDG